MTSTPSAHTFVLTWFFQQPALTIPGLLKYRQLPRLRVAATEARAGNFIIIIWAEPERIL